MKQVLLALVLAHWVFAHWATAPVAADPAAPAAPGVRAVISGQIEAFRSGDAAGAFDFASDGIRALFGTADNFAAMVARGYAMVIAPGEVQYGELREEAGARVQRVLIRDGAGVWHALDYLMVEQDGAWRIGGVELLAEPAVGA